MVWCGIMWFWGGLGCFNGPYTTPGNPGPGCVNKRIKHSFPCAKVCQARV